MSTSHGTALQATFIPEPPARFSGFAGYALGFGFWGPILHLCLSFYGISLQEECSFPNSMVLTIFSKVKPMKFSVEGRLKKTNYQSMFEKILSGNMWLTGK